MASTPHHSTPAKHCISLHSIAPSLPSLFSDSPSETMDSRYGYVAARKSQATNAHYKRVHNDLMQYAGPRQSVPCFLTGCLIAISQLCQRALMFLRGRRVSGTLCSLYEGRWPRFSAVAIYMSACQHADLLLLCDVTHTSLFLLLASHYFLVHNLALAFK